MPKDPKEYIQDALESAAELMEEGQEDTKTFERHVKQLDRRIDDWHKEHKDNEQTS